MDDKISIGKKLINQLIEKRNTLGYSQRDLEALTGIKQSAIARLESEKNPNPSILTIIKIARVLGLKLELVTKIKEE